MTGTAFLSQKKKYTKNRSVCKNALGLVRELGAPTHWLLIALRLRESHLTVNLFT